MGHCFQRLVLRGLLLELHPPALHGALCLPVKSLTLTPKLALRGLADGTTRYGK